MHCILTARRALHPTPDQACALHRTHHTSRGPLHAVGRCACARATVRQQVRLPAVQAVTTLDLRATVGLPAQLAHIVPHEVDSTGNTPWTELRAIDQATVAARAARRTQQRERGPGAAPNDVSLTRTYQYRRDDNLCQFSSD
jgi:hypothetical protein